MSVRKLNRGRQGVRLAEVAELAEAVAGEHCPEMPVEPERIARAKGVTFSYGQYGHAFDGMLEWRDGRFHIFCNLDRVRGPATPRARFTLAHELGHYFIDEHRLALTQGAVAPHLSRCQYESPSLAEREADRFAAHLLMPTPAFQRAAKAVPKGIAGMRQLAAEFGVSLTASAVRYVALDLAPCAVLKWNWDGCAWRRFNSWATRIHPRRTFSVPDRLAEGCPTRRALAGEKPSEPDGYFRAGAVASAWFRGIRASSDRDEIFVEEAIPLGRFGVLTVLYPQ
jgi:hypothetical protein